MKVTPVAHTMIDWNAFASVVADTTFGDDAVDEYDITDADHLAEFAGRACYKSYGRDRPETATTEGYLHNIQDHGHFSVFEHASVTFYVEGVSRALLLELERHRFLSFSVESQRYVNTAQVHPEPVNHPLLAEAPAEVWAELQRFYGASLDRYERTMEILAASGITGKRAREAARGFLLESTPVDLIVTGNMRAWRDVLGKRYSVHADAEIREFATAVLGCLRDIAPLTVQDFPEDPFGSADGA